MRSRRTWQTHDECKAVPSICAAAACAARPSTPDLFPSNTSGPHTHTHMHTGAHKGHESSSAWEIWERVLASPASRARRGIHRCYPCDAGALACRGVRRSEVFHQRQLHIPTQAASARLDVAGRENRCRLRARAFPRRWSGGMDPRLATKRAPALHHA